MNVECELTLKQQEKNPIYEVSQLVSLARLLLIQRFSLIWVSGEISNLSTPKSGHLYFSLKDDKSQVRCALFNQYYLRCGLHLKEGMQVLVRGTVSIYEARGDFQLVVDHVELAGEGKLRRAFETLKAKLAQEGLFDPKHKKELPKFPKKIGVITSSTGAALRDVLTLLNQRFASIPVIVYPTLVQGELAAKQIVATIEKANERMECDVLLICRGGGSIEDLWAFNEEAVVRAIFNSTLAIITGIGHETDFTLSDFVADVRAPTPSGAAVLAVAESSVLTQQINQINKQLIRIIQSHLNKIQDTLTYLTKSIISPKEKLKGQSERLIDLHRRLITAIDYEIYKQTTSFKQAYIHWKQLTPLNQIGLLKQQCTLLEKRLERSIQSFLEILIQKLEGLNLALESMSPLNTLNRGYAIALKNETLLVDASFVQVGDQIRLKLAKGELLCLVSYISD